MKILLLLLISANVAAINSSEFVKLLEQNHPFFAIQKYNKINLEIAKDIANPYQDWMFNSSINHTTNNQLIGDNNVIINSINKENISGSKFSLTNTTAKNQSKNNNHSNILNIKYNIPLGKNKSGINSKLKQDIVKINIEINNLQTKINNTNFININLKKLFTLKFLMEKVRINQKQLTNSKQQLKIIKDKFNNNLVDKADVLLQENNYQNQQISLISVKRELSSNKKELQKLINKKINSLTVNLIKLQNIDNAFFSPNKTSKVKIIELKKQIYNRELSSSYNKNKTQIDLNVSARNSKKGNSSFAGNSDNSIGIGLEISLPIGNTTNKNIIKQQKNSIITLNKEKEQTILELNNQYENIISRISTTKQIISINQQQIKNSTAKTKEYEKMYINSNTELKFVIDARTQQQQIELSYFSNLLQYKNLILDYHNLLQ